MAYGHIHNWALSALLELRGQLLPETKSELARRAEVTPQEFGDLLSGRRAGSDPDKRGRLADELGVDVRAITCWCSDRPGNHQEGRR